MVRQQYRPRFLLNVTGDAIHYNGRVTGWSLADHGLRDPRSPIYNQTLQFMGFVAAALAETLSAATHPHPPSACSCAQGCKRGEWLRARVAVNLVKLALDLGRITPASDVNIYPSLSVVLWSSVVAVNGHVKFTRKAGEPAVFIQT